jgi:hypothetical protein
MLNKVLEKLDEVAVFEFLGEKSTQKFISEIISLGNHYDCNPSGILQGIGVKLSICTYCFKHKPIFYEGWCEECTWKIGINPEEVESARIAQS